MNSFEVVAACEPFGLTYRKLDYWCRQGVFGRDKSGVKQGGRRFFDDEDLQVAKVIARVSTALGGARFASVNTYRAIADQMYSGVDEVMVEFAPGIHLYVDLGVKVGIDGD